MLLTSAIAISNLLCRRTNICEIAEPCLTSFEELDSMPLPCLRANGMPSQEPLSVSALNPYLIRSIGAMPWC